MVRKDTRGPWGWDCGRDLKEGGETDGNLKKSGLLEVAGVRDLLFHAFSLCPISKVMFTQSSYSCFPPRMLVGAPWDGPSGDRRGDVYRCPVGGSHSAPCAKGHLGKTVPHSSTPSP